MFFSVISLPILSYRTRAVLLAALTCAPGAGADIATASTWVNSGSDWFNPLNWNGGVPTLSQGAFLPATGGAISPQLAILQASANALVVDNSAGVYSILSPLDTLFGSPTQGTYVGTLTLGTGGYQNLGGGTTNLNAALRVTAPTTFDIAANTTTIVGGRFWGGSATNTFTKQGNGTMVLNQGAPLTGTGAMPVNILAGTLAVRNSIALGNAPNIVVHNGAFFQLDTAQRYSGGNFTSVQLGFGDPNNQLTLKNGATLRSTPITGPTTPLLYGKTMIENGGIASISMATNGGVAISESLLNSTPAPAGTSSQIKVTGAGVMTLNGHSGTANAFTGTWIIDHGMVGDLTGLTFVNDYDSLGVSNTGYAAPVSLVSGFLTDARSSSAAPMPNPITMNGGVLNALYSVARPQAYMSGTIDVQALGGSTIDMSAVNVANLAGAVCNINLTGKITGAGLLSITAPTTNPQARGVTTFTNTSLANPNTISGNVVVQWNSALAATTDNSGSNPLGSGTVTLAAGELRLNHPGAGSNGIINTFAANSIALKGVANFDLPAVQNRDGTITLGNAGSGNTGNVIALNRLTFDATGTSPDQTLVVQSAAPGTNYTARFDGITQLVGNATITTGANPADVILNGKVTGPGNLTKAGNSTLTLAHASSDYTGATSVQGGTLVFGAIHRLGALTIATGARAVVPTTGARWIKANTLSINGTGALDLGDHHAILTGATLAETKQKIAQGFNTGAWTGSGITSSAAATIAANTNQFHKTALGYATAQQIGATEFLGEPVNASDMLIRYTLSGDANLDGTVNGLDFSAISTWFNQSGQNWANGDFNYDGLVNALDFNAIATNFGQNLPLSGDVIGLAGANVPEPVLHLALAAVVALRGRRRR